MTDSIFLNKYHRLLGDMEPLLHIVLPLAALLLLDVKPRDAVVLATLGVVPDVDALLLIHRSLSHSIIIMALITAPLFLYARIRKSSHQYTVLLAFLVLASHIILDLESPTPILWPIIENSYSVEFSLNGVMEKGIGLRPSLSINSTPTVFTKAMGFDYPLFTQEGLLISIVLLAPIIYNQLKNWFTRE